MKEYNIDSLKGFIELISERLGYGFIYRGVENIDKHLLIHSNGNFSY